MKLSLLPPLMMVCANLLLRDPRPFLSVLAFPSNTNIPDEERQECDLLFAAQVKTVGSSADEIFHPATGTCVVRKSFTEPLRLGPCEQSDRWEYTQQKILKAKYTYFCLQAEGAGEAVKLGLRCTPPGSTWAITRDPVKKKPRLSSEIQGVGSLCLDVGAGDVIVTNPCLSSDNQWFEIAPMNAGSSTLVASASSSDSSP